MDSRNKVILLPQVLADPNASSKKTAERIAKPSVVLNSAPFPQKIVKKIRGGFTTLIKYFSTQPCLFDNL